MSGALRAIRAALAEHPFVFASVTAAVAALNVVAPVAILSAVRKPVDYYTFNPWLRRLPEYLASDEAPLAEKMAKLSDLALFWFSAGSSYGGAEWGFAVDVKDAVRILLISALFGLYFALWRRYRDLAPGNPELLRRGGVAGAAATVVGVSTGACSVTGCGAPVLPVLGLAFTGLESGTLHFLAQSSRLATIALFAAVAAAAGYLAWKVTPPTARIAPPTQRAA
jgi:hypothetical protein